MKKPRLECGQYRMKVSVKWVLKDGYSDKLICKACDGTGTRTGGPYWGNDQQPPCLVCQGDGLLDNPDVGPKPAMPQDFIDHMLAAFDEYMENNG